jgi:hypothetical protein
MEYGLVLYCVLSFSQTLPYPLTPLWGRGVEDVSFGIKGRVFEEQLSGGSLWSWLSLIHIKYY